MVRMTWSRQHCDEAGVKQPSTLDILRQTSFMGSPLLANNEHICTSASAYPGILSSADECKAGVPFPTSGSINEGNGTRHQLFVRTSQDRMPSRVVDAIPSEAFPAIWPANDQLSKSGLFTTPPQSSTASPTFLPEMTTQRIDDISLDCSVNEYRTAPEGKYAAEQRRLVPSVGRGGEEIRPQTLLGTQMVSWNEPMSSATSLMLDPPLLSRRFSFDEGAPDDQTFVKAVPRRRTPSPLHHPLPSQRAIARVLSQPNRLATESSDYRTPHPQPQLQANRPGMSFDDILHNISKPPRITLKTSFQHGKPVHGSTEEGSRKPPFIRYGPPSPVVEPLVNADSASPTRFYRNACRKHGRQASRRWTPRGTLRLPNHVASEWRTGINGEVDEFQPPHPGNGVTINSRSSDLG